MLSLSPPTLVTVPTKDFVIKVPEEWRTQLDSYPGRLLVSLEPSYYSGQRDGNFAGLRVSRIGLGALKRSAKVEPLASDAGCSNWEEVTVGNTSASTIALWMMLAGQKSAEAGLGYALDLRTEILDAQVNTTRLGGSGSELTWHAVVTKPTGTTNSGRTMPVSDFGFQATDVGIGSRVSSGRALLRGGVVLFTVADAPQERFKPGYAGLQDGTYLDRVVQTLEFPSV